MTTQDWKPFDELVIAMSGLEDITTFRTDPNIANMRANLIERYDEETVSAYEVLGVARAVAARFRSHTQEPEEMYYCATKAMFHAVVLRVHLRSFDQPKEDYHTFLLTHLDWVHATHLCPVTTYLQLTLRNTPLDDWAAAATADKDASPLAFAWVWARAIGSQTAEVAALVTMGRQVHRLMVEAEMRKREPQVKTLTTKLFDDGFWITLGGAVKDWAATWVQHSPSDLTNYNEAADSEGLHAMVQRAAEALRERGERYAQLLGEEDMAQEREAVVDSIRTLAGFILGKAEPPVPETVLLALTDLATAA
ncbi:hypothetical protein C8F01DRAFT_1000595 [Mycena amicta]|nr:hypothetical protein C8F01DRAFT_1000595 [Mycena amicta]